MKNFNDCKLHHRALTRGYVSVKDNEPYIAYKGRFGEGYTRLRYNPNSTQYCIIEYYIRQTNK